MAFAAVPRPRDPRVSPAVLLTLALFLISMLLALRNPDGYLSTMAGIIAALLVALSAAQPRPSEA